MKSIKLHGGLKIKLHLPAHETPIEDVPPPKRVILPLSDRPGIFCRPLVERGEMVFKGEKIGEDPDARMTPVHSPVSGRVTDITDYRFAEGGNTLSIFIESDGQGSWKTDLRPLEDFAVASPGDIIMALRDSGVKIIPREILPDTGGAGTEVTAVRYFVINGIGHGFAGSIARRLLVEKCADVLEATRFVNRMLRPEKIYLVTNEKHDDVARSIAETGLETAVEVIKLKVFYPLGHPHLLFKAIFNKEIPCPEGKAIDMGVVFTNVDTVIHALEAVKLGKPMIKRYVTVSGQGIKTPKNLKVLIGTPLEDLFEFCGGFDGRPGKLSLGNPLDGMAQFSLDRPVLKDTRWLWAQPEDQVVKERYRACINCGDCVDVCPVGLMPNFLGKFCEFGSFEEAASNYHLFTCIECGLCAYVCPSRRPLVQFLTYGKRELSLKERDDGIV